MLKKLQHFLILSIALCAFSFTLNAQISAVQITPVNAVNQVLLGSGVVATNITANSTTPDQIGKFSNGISAQIGIDCGLILTSGFLDPSQGSLYSFGVDSTSSDQPGSGSDPDLALIASGTINDAAVLQFDFTPTGNTINFRYVFASEEYNDYVGTNFNDVFGFFLTGPNPNGGNYTAQNIAIIPFTTLPVTINNLNNGGNTPCGNGPCTNCAYFVDNCNGTVPFIFDGHTTVLTATANVVPNQTYTIKLAVSDVFDGALDAAVFLEANSFTSGTSQVVPTYNFSGAISDTALYEGCSDLTLQFVRTGDLTFADTAYFTISGTATNGTDYGINNNPVPNFISFAPSQDTVVMVITPYSDVLFGEANETFGFLVTSLNPCGDTITTGVEFTIINVTQLQVDAGPDKTICTGMGAVFNANITGGVPPYGITWTYPGGTATANPDTVSPNQSGWCKIVVQDGCSLFPSVTDSFFINVTPIQFNISFTTDSLSCFGTLDGGINTTVSGNTAPFSFTWSNGGITEDLTGLAAGTYSVLVIDSNQCADTASITVFQPQLLNLNFPNVNTCSEEDLTLNPNPIAGMNYTYSPATGLNNANIPSPILNIPNNTANPLPVVYTVTYDSAHACGSSTFTVSIISSPAVSLGLPGFDTTSICFGQNILLANSDTSTVPTITSYLWNNGTSQSTFNTSTEGLYWLEVAGSTGCVNRDSIYVNVQKQIQLVLPPQFQICGTEPITISVPDSVDANIYSWSNGDSTQSISVNTAGTYSVTITNSCGVQTATTDVTQQKTITPSDLANIITPNGDGINDVFDAGNIFDGALFFECKIYNRWGNLILKTENISILWAPEKLSEGVYFYTIQYKDCNQNLQNVKGNITIANSK